MKKVPKYGVGVVFNTKDDYMIRDGQKLHFMGVYK